MAMMLRRLVRIAPLALLFAGTAIAQNTSSITGVVTDASTGKPVVGAVVVVTSPALPAEQTVVTEAGGKFAVPDLPAGDYTLAVQMDGYKPFERADLKLKEETTLRANAAVVPEAVQMEEVVVTGSRIRRKDLNTPAPVTVLNREAVQASGKVSIGDFLQSLPEQGNAINTGVNNGGDGSVRINLRSLGVAAHAGAGQRPAHGAGRHRRRPSGGPQHHPHRGHRADRGAEGRRLGRLRLGRHRRRGQHHHAQGLQRRRSRATTRACRSHGDAQINDVCRHRRHVQRQGQLHLLAGYYDQQKAMAGDRDFSKFQVFFDPTGQNYGPGGQQPAGQRARAGRTRLCLAAPATPPSMPSRPPTGSPAAT